MQPKWEAGVGLSGLYLNHYYGSDQKSGYLLPFPYFIYRGDKIGVDRSGINGKLFRSDKLELKLSMSAHLPVSSADDDARAGMPDLNPMVEIGPMLTYRLYRSRQAILKMEIPLRSSTSVDDFRLHYEGLVSNPRLRSDYYYKNLKWTSSVGPLFGDSGYQSYFYSVSPKYATDQRQAYSAVSGYMGAKLSMGLRVKYKNLVTGAFFHYINLDGAQNLDSPLLRKKDYISSGFYLAWILKTSQDQ